MTIDELQVQLDISSGNELTILKQYAHKIDNGYLFVDSDNGQCYLFNKRGHLDDIRKVKSIEDNAFEDCISLERIVIPNSVKSIRYGAFYYCTSLKNVVIPNSVKSIGDGAFNNCTSLNSIMIPDSVKSIGNSAFWNCKSLNSIIIPDSVKSIGGHAFTYCKSLKEIIFKGKTIYQVKTMWYYPWDIEDISVIKCR